MSVLVFYQCVILDLYLYNDTHSPGGQSLFLCYFVWFKYLKLSPSPTWSQQRSQEELRGQLRQFVLKHTTVCVPCSLLWRAYVGWVLPLLAAPVASRQDDTPPPRLVSKQHSLLAHPQSQCSSRVSLLDGKCKVKQGQKPPPWNSLYGQRAFAQVTGL